MVSLRKWMRWKQRAQELGVTIPDPTVLARSLNKMINVKKVLELQPELAFRMALARNALQLDSIPSHEAVEKYAEHALSEVEAIAHLEKEVKTPATKTQMVDAKVKKVDAVDGKNETKKAGKDIRPCKFFLSEKGCRRGRGCKWSHDQKDEKMRCWSCGASEHLRKDCPVAVKTGTRRRSARKPRRNQLRGQRPHQQQCMRTFRERRVRHPVKKTMAMKDVLQEATKMLRSLNVKAPGKSAQEEEEKKLLDLQKQLDGMRERMRVRQIKLSKVETAGVRGLVEWGATNPLRAVEEDVASYEERTVELAAGKTHSLRVTLGRGHTCCGGQENAADHSHGHAHEGPELQGQMEWESVRYPFSWTRTTSGGDESRVPGGAKGIGTQPDPGAGG